MAVAPETLSLIFNPQRHLLREQVRETLRQNPDLREQIRELRDDWNDAVYRWSVNRTCELGSAEHMRQMEPINNEANEKLNILLGFHIPRDDVSLAIAEALRAPSRSRSRSRSRWQHPGVHKYALEEA